jgi:carbonic anhydrase
MSRLTFPIAISTISNGVRMLDRRQILTALPIAAALPLVAQAAQAQSGQVDNVVMNSALQKAMTPDQALAELKAGNERFLTGRMYRRDWISQVKATAEGQYPFAVVLGCIDSRVPPEVVFDQGIGDIFSPRIAGNFANTDIIGSIEFATQLAGAKLIVVLGHSECGAVKGACDGAVMGNLTTTLSNLAPAVYSVRDVVSDRTSKNKKFVQQVADANVKLTVDALVQRSSVLGALVAKRELKVVGAMHSVATGKVDFLS